MSDTHRRRSGGRQPSQPPAPLSIVGAALLLLAAACLSCVCIAPASGHTLSQPTCLPCPDGAACGSPSVNSTVCSAGQYLPPGSMECTGCPAGYACPDPEAPPFLCGQGTYSGGNLTACVICPVGTECQLSGGVYPGPPTTCAAGTFRTVLTTDACSPCTAGYYCESGVSYPQPCATGRFSLGSAANCTVCPAGMQCPNKNAPATGCLQGTYSEGGLTSCTLCPAGSVCAANAVDTSVPCPVGHYCPRGSFPPGTPCPAGSWRNETGAMIAQDCHPCPANFSCPTGFVLPQPCADGYICPEATKTPTSFPCLPGTYLPTSQEQRASRADCLPCPEGFYCGSATVVPVACAAGTFCPLGSSSPAASPCPLGTWGSAIGQANNSLCFACDAGTYCPYGASAPVPCPPGTYNPQNSSYLASNCRACDGSRSCSTFGLAEPNGDCQTGHYCPEGTVNDGDTPCPAGRYTDSTSAYRLADCELCPEGFACYTGSTSATKVECDAGHYCPAGTGSPTQYRCPSGTFFAGTNATASTDCTTCPAGSVCEGGRGYVSGVCAVGHYCPSGTNSSTQFPCAAGTYLNVTTGVEQADCDACPTGHFCPTGSASPTPCSAGTYNPTPNAVSDGMITSSLIVSAHPACTSCDAGMYCPTPGLSAATLTCAPGSYSAAGASACSACPEGYYCPNPATTPLGGGLPPTQCPEGYWCKAGQSDFVVNPCVGGTYCPAGSSGPLNCPLGTFNVNGLSTSLAACLACPAGSYCKEAETGVSGPCAPGHYCPERSSTAYAVPCPEAYRRQLTGAAVWTDCTDCPAGSYCPRGSVDGIVCPQGFYCPDRLAAPIACPKGTYGNSTGLQSVSECWSCDGGKFCDQVGLSAPAGLCDPGFYCVNGATTSQPAQGSTGGPCPAGGYCPQGSWTSLPCPAGRYQNVSGASDITLCQKCPPGYYCASTSNAGPTGPCTAGWYCTGSSDSPIQFASPAGYYSINGSSAPIPCSVGTYAPSANSSSCGLCDAGFFCPNQTSVFLTECPKGAFCVQGSSFPTSCLPGFYNPSAQGTNLTACLPCPVGKYCADNGNFETTGDCAAGFYCQTEAQSPTPGSIAQGGLPCPEGYYCPQGTTAPVPCDPGTYSETPMLQDQTGCTACPPGKFCALPPMIAVGAAPIFWSDPTPTVRQDCAEGFYCTGSASTATPATGPTGGSCTVGHYCPAGSSVELECAAGTYNDEVAAGSCKVCPAGSYCVAGSTTGTTLCNQGYYCPNGTQSATQYPCPLGTYGAANGATSFADCLPCLPGQYCASLAAITPTGYCAAGYYCTTAASDPYGTKNVTGSVATLCPAGFYCPSGQSNPLPCPAGTFRNITGGVAESSCFNCTAGQYCAGSNLLAPTGPCAANYSCPSGSDTPTPAGYLCPAGSMCPTGSPQPTLCAAGSFQSAAGQAICEACTQGFYCELGEVTPQSCPQGYYCPTGTTTAHEFPCPAGTFQPLTERTSSQSCQACTSGWYCNVASINPTAMCNAGYFCPGNNTTPTPPATPCGLGNFCPIGSANPEPCPPNYYCPLTTLAIYSQTCQPGWYCLLGATSSMPTNPAQGGQCPAGKWCPGSSERVDCVAGTYNPMVGSTNVAACLSCLGGFQCNGTALAAVSGPCPAGYACNNGTSVVSSGDACPRGHKCVQGTYQAVACPAGEYQDQTQQSTCETCPAGYYCPGLGTADPVDCPYGSYCLAGTRLASQYLCPTGFYNDALQSPSIDYCKPCSGGHQCSLNGSTTAFGQGACAAGYYCEGGSNTPSPNALSIVWNGRNYTNDRCLSGHYCLAGSNTSTVCPEGTFAVGRGNVDASACKPCPAGQFCSTAGATAASGQYCKPGFLCVSGATVDSPMDGVTGYPCPVGTYCLQGALNTSNCAPGTFNPFVAQSNCSTCLAGYYCSDWGQSAGYQCPLGFYCPAGTAQPLGCPAGSFGAAPGLSAASDCTLCPVGKYCGSQNLTMPTDDCAAGFFCDLGSFTSHPTGPSSLVGAGANSGPCPAGYYCPIGTTSWRPCPIGTYLPANSSASAESQCIPCTAGMYCDTLHLSAPSGFCADGFWCPTGSSNATATACPAGQYCKKPYPAPQDCTNGTFTNTPQQSSCAPCPARSYCVNSELVPRDCPVQFYCPLGTGAPLTCPPGSYSLTANLAAASECMPCPAGQYCNNGVIQDICAAGYLCTSGNWLAQPTGNTTVGGLCPAGYWCDAGVTAPTPCLAGTLRTTPGAAVITQCLDCSIGYECLQGNPVPVPCQAGFYCLADGSHNPCPAGTYQPLLAQTNISSCITCPAGYQCSTSALSDYAPFPCLPGSYCQPGLANSSTCPAGTFNPNSHGETVADCSPCTGGFTCQIGATLETPCLGGTFCPPQSSFSSPCPPQFYCPNQAAWPLDCPGGYFCPANSTSPIYCELGTYCPPQSAAPLLCPSGYISLSVENRTSLDAACYACPAGFYSAAQSDTNCTTCDGGYVCTGSANVAAPLTAAEGGYICPAGYYCEAGTSAPVPCPAGSYNSFTGQGSLSSCLLCPANTFQSLSGQIGCKPCTASSVSGVGSASCSCAGKNRAFQPSDQSCICQPGHEFISDSHRLSEEDDVVDCQPIILSRCSSGEARDSRGKCVNSRGSDCPATQCNGGSGKFSVPLGVCECDGQSSLDTVCGSDCRNLAPQMTMSNNAVIVTDPSLVGVAGVNASYSMPMDSIPGFIGAPDCRTDAPCKFFSVVVKQGVGGQYGAPPSLIDHAVKKGLTTLSHNRGFATMGHAAAGGSAAARKLSQAGTLYDGTNHILNPAVICLVSGEGLLFDVSNAALTGNYPIYLKDNLLNSNPTFDWGYFRNLSSAIASNASSVSLFAFSFHAAGVYVFADAAYPDQITIVRVVDTNQLCPTPLSDPLARIEPFQFRSLISNGVTRNQNVVITPDWALLGIMIALLVCLVGLIVLGLYFFQTHSWGNGAPTSPAYKKIALQENLDVWNLFSSKGTVRSVDNVSKGLTSLSAQQDALASVVASKPAAAVSHDLVDEAAVAATSSDGADVMAGMMGEWEDGNLTGVDPNDQYMNELSSHLDLEGFDFHSLYKMLDETKSSVEGYFIHQEDGLKQFYERMAMEIDHLKNVLAVKMQVQLHKTGEGLSEAVDRLVSGELLARQAFQDLSRRRELELTKTLEQLVTCIRNLNEEYHLFPIQELVRLTNEHILYCERGLAQERNRRKIFANHTEIVGRPIIDALSKADLAEEAVQNSYMDALKMFEAAVVELLRKMLGEEQAHASAMEKLDESSTDKRKLETDRFHLNVCKLAKEIQQQLSYLDENLTPIFESLREMEDKTHHVWVHVQGELLEQRWQALLHPTEGRLFRGINPELAKVLTGLLGMKGGLAVDPLTGVFQPKTPFDASDPFDTLFDYQKQAEAERERAELDSDDSDEEGGTSRRRKKKGADSDDDNDDDTARGTKKKKRRNSDGELVTDDETDTKKGRKKHTGDEGDDDDDADAAQRATGETDADDAEAGDDVSGALPGSAEEMRAKALADLKKQRRLIEHDMTLTDEERAQKLAEIDRELATLKKLFDGGLDTVRTNVEDDDDGQGNNEEDDAAQIAQLKALLQAKHAQLEELDAQHHAEEAALLRQLDREDAEANDSFAVDLTRFDALINGEDGAGGLSPHATARRKKIQHADGSYDEVTEETVDNDERKEYPESSSTLLSEYQVNLNDMRASGASDDAIKERMMEMHAQKRQELREKRLKALKIKQESEAETIKHSEANAKEKLQAHITDQAELAAVMEALNITDASKSGAAAGGAGGAAGGAGGEPGAAGSSSSSAASAAAAAGGMLGGSTIVPGVTDAPLDPQSAAEFEKNRQAIERRYKRAQLDREARNAVAEAFEYAKLELRQELMLQNRLKAKLAGLSAGDDGKQTEDELRDLMKGADADRANVEAALQRERDAQRKKLQEAMAARKKAQADKSGKAKAAELKQESRKLEDANKTGLKNKEKQKIAEALSKLDENTRRKLAKKVIEMVMAPRHNRELENMISDQMEERMAFVADEMERMAAAGEPINFLAIEQAAAAKFDQLHASQVAALLAKHRQEVRDTFKEHFPDESFDGEEWQHKEGDEMAEYQRRRREMTLKSNAAKGAGDDDTDDAVAKLAAEANAKQRAHEARLKAEAAEVEKMNAEFEAVEAARKAKRAALEEEQKKRELDLLDDLSDAQRLDILNQHKLNLKNFERALDNERVKQAGLLEKSLEERRRKLALLKAQRKAAAEKEALMEKQMKKRLKKKVMKKLKDDSVSATTDLWKMRAAAAMAGTLPGGAGMGGGGGAMDLDDVDDGNDSDDGVARHKKRLARDEAERKEATEKQEVIQRLRAIETMVEKIGSQTNQWRGQIFVDDKDLNDAAYAPVGTTVAVCPVGSLDAKSLVLYRFGVNLLEVLFARGIVQSPVNGISSRASHTPVHLLIGSSLPPNVHQSTAYRNSFHYQSQDSILFIRRERLQDVGQFLLVLCHCMAHISTSASVAHAGLQTNGAAVAAVASSSAPPAVGVVEGWDDRNPAFVGAFHACLRFICADMFYAQAHKALVAAPHVLPLVQPLSSPPVRLAGEEDEEGQIEGSSSSSSSSVSEGLSDPAAAAWISGTVRGLAIDELLSLHPVSSLDGAHPSGSSVSGAASLHHSSHWSTARMLERLHDYQAFAHASALKANLCELEKSSRAREHARELKEARSFRQRAVRGVPPPTPADDKSWQVSAPRSGQEMGAAQLHDIEDDLTAELSAIAEQLYQHTHHMQQAERDARETRAKAALTAADQAALTKLDAAVQNDKALIAQLNRAKDNAIYRLRNVHAAAKQIEGGDAGSE